MKEILVLTFIFALSISAVCFAGTEPVPEDGSIADIKDIETYSGSLVPPEIGSIAGGHKG